jgi:hypothetical protein
MPYAPNEVTGIENEKKKKKHSLNCLRSLERWDRGFESQLRHGYLFMSLFCVFVVG